MLGRDKAGEGMTRLWIVRAGRHGERELAAIEQSKLFAGATTVLKGFAAMPGFV